MTQTRVTITGATGQLGGALLAKAPETWSTVPLSRADADLSDWRSTLSAITGTEPQIVIHAAAETDVDRCELNPDLAFKVNAVGTRYVAQAAAEIGAIFVYISTNFVFNGAKYGAYHEFDAPDPISVYGASKLAGEVEAMTISSPVYIVRTSQIYDESGRNFVNTMRALMAGNDRITVVDDQFGNPSYAADLANGIVDLLDRAPPGLYHLTNSGVASWYDWALRIAQIIGSETEVIPIQASDFIRPAQPPENGALRSLFLADIGIQMPDWTDALQRCLGR